LCRDFKESLIFDFFNLLYREDIMELRILCSTFLILWLMSMSIFGCAYMKGKKVVSPGTDRRTEVVLEPAQRDQLLKEMRQLLQGVHGILTGLSGQEIDAQKVEESGRSVGMKMASDSDPAIMGKLPPRIKRDRGGLRGLSRIYRQRPLSPPLY
jgi:hypothetical protein